ncbi:MAG TPA: NADH-quinone oxidoreductase subunit L, partial [Methylomirabilota bacterium]|nr:NADH-quinone oxidoreductase subunit L [Methylomirabilota bacterium]
GRFGTITVACLLLFTGAIGKSAQLPLYVWLPDAMEGPTPVSALIHAATMVTAGVYVVARSHVLFSHSPTAMLVVAVVGCATAFFAATIGLVQNDIKKVLAYSTVSQLGYMFLACGVGAFTAGIFHLMTHAFFKALLFLSAGSVIHAMGGEQDLRRMGGLASKIRWTWLTMLMATFAIAGAPGFSGFFSKDAILLAAASSKRGGAVLYAFGLFTALLTAFYMFRLVFLAFHGKPRFDEHEVHVHESPKSMLVPLVILALLSIGGGWMAAPEFFGGENHFDRFLGPALAARETAVSGAEAASAHTLMIQLASVAVFIALAGFLLAWWLYVRRPELPGKIAAAAKGAYTTLLNKYYVDEIYSAVIVRPLLWISTRVLWQNVDARGIDGTVNGIARGAVFMGDRLRRVQSGNTRSYAVWVVIGALLVLFAVLVWPHLGASAGGAQVLR